MSNSLVLDVAIGVVFVFFIVALTSSAATEAVARILGLRGKQLLQGIRALVDGEAAPSPAAVPSEAAVPGAAPAAPAPAALPVSNTARILATPVLRSLGQTSFFPGTHALMPRRPDDAELQDVEANINQLTGKWTRKARAKLREVPAYLSSRQFGQAVVALVIPDDQGATTFAQIEAGINKLPDGILRHTLLELAKNANGDIGRFRDSIENWYDDHMARVSGWYKRRTRWITLA